MDDFLHAGDQFFERLMNKLRVKFSAGKVEEKLSNTLGLEYNSLQVR